MKRPVAAASIMVYLQRNCSPADFIWHRETLIVVRRPGRAPLCLVPLAHRQRLSEAERANHELLRAEGIRVEPVHSPAEVELALRGKLLDALRARKAEHEAEAAALAKEPLWLSVTGTVMKMRRREAVGQLQSVPPSQFATHRGGRRLGRAA